jgi:hypothetical protein
MSRVREGFLSRWVKLTVAIGVSFGRAWIRTVRPPPGGRVKSPGDGNLRMLTGLERLSRVDQMRFV